MQYHALSLLRRGHSVTLVGYDGETLIDGLQQRRTCQNPSARSDNTLDDDTNTTTTTKDNDNGNNNDNDKVGGTLHVVRFTVPTLPSWLSSSSSCGGGVLHRVLYFAWRILSLTWWTWWTLITRVIDTTDGNDIDAVLVQNPPAVPLLALAWMYCRYCYYRRVIITGIRTVQKREKQRQRQQRRPALIIDWHNLGYSMLSSDGVVQRLARTYERFWGPTADAHMTVTTALRRYLQDEFLRTTTSRPLRISEVPDCPPSMFRPCTVEEQHELLQRLALERYCPREWWSHLDTKTQTLWTEERRHIDGTTAKKIRYRRGRPALITSSTSWTADEDFGTLLRALVELDMKISAAPGGGGSALRVVVVVTGKGPQKSMYEERMSRLTMHHVAITTLWLEPRDYPRLLAAADVGVSLHTSTSGMDLPMKILDSFGCHVPVCAVQFASLHELVQDGVNGRVFTDGTTLANILWELLHPLGDGRKDHNNNNNDDDDDDDDGDGLANHAFGALAEYSKALQDRPRWDENWQQRAWPLLEQVTRERG